jgi:hypothetical protein
MNKPVASTSLTVEVQGFAVGFKLILHMHAPDVSAMIPVDALLLHQQLLQHRFGCPDASKGNHYYLIQS